MKEFKDKSLVEILSILIIISVILTIVLEMLGVIK